MTGDIFNFQSYKEYLSFWLAQEKPRSGLKSALAQAIGCHTTYLSQVLGGQAHFSLEQAVRLGAFFQLSDGESDYLLTLVSQERAGTPELRRYFERRLKVLRAERFQIKDRVRMSQVLSPEDRAQYYSQWYFAAIHVAVSVRSLRTKESVADYFGLPIHVVMDVLKFLVAVGLVQEKEGLYEIGQTQIHLGQNTSDIVKHHTHWRLQAITSLEKKRDADLHYSAVVTLSRRDVDLVKTKLLAVIQETLREIVSSSEEEVFGYCLDFFDLKR